MWFIVLVRCFRISLDSYRQSRILVSWVRWKDPEKADRFSKAGSLVSQPNSPLPLRNIKRLIYSKLQINRASQYGVVAAGKKLNILLNKGSRILSSLPLSVA
ncbi:hypothetical protein TNCV_4216601 [Trichonephila clavipes]|nr:hypothetical protein TNCV_4216601 [Trichonephila clavipes]